MQPTHILRIGRFECALRLGIYLLFTRRQHRWRLSGLLRHVTYIFKFSWMSVANNWTCSYCGLIILSYININSYLKILITWSCFFPLSSFCVCQIIPVVHTNAYFLCFAQTCFCLDLFRITCVFCFFLNEIVFMKWNVSRLHLVCHSVFINYFIIH